MEAKAEIKYVKISARKVRQVIPLIKGKPVEIAKNILRFTPKKGAKLLLGLLNSAIANARQKRVYLSPHNLIVKRAFANGGPIQRRMQPGPKGRANPILKRSSHITVVVEEIS